MQPLICSLYLEPEDGVKHPCRRLYVKIADVDAAEHLPLRDEVLQP